MVKAVSLSSSTRIPPGPRTTNFVSPSKQPKISAKAIYRGALYDQHAPHISWAVVAGEFLDVLFIMDCCFSSVAAMGPRESNFEYLVASVKILHKKIPT